MDRTTLLDAVVKLVETVGRFQMSHFRTLPAGGGTEKQARETVSEVDVHSEELLLEGLSDLLPDAGFYGEESGTQGNAAFRWVVDPLDGTSNYLSGLEQFSISVALEKDGRTELGVVFRPASGECYAALRGAGVRRNHVSCPPVPAGDMSRALIGTGFPFRSPDLARCFFPCAEEVLYASRGIRRFGSAALDLSYVAAGFLQGFWESDLQPYDVAAALLFLEESGCTVTNLQGQPYSPYQDRLMICGFPLVHESLLEIVAKHYTPTA